MMQIIEINALSNGAHSNQTFHGVLPDGWATIPEDMEIPATFPFVRITVDGDVVTSMEANREALDEYLASLPDTEPTPDTDEGDQPVTWNELAKAYNEGVNSLDK